MTAMKPAADRDRHDVPLWRSTNPTVDRNNNIWPEGLVVSSVARPGSEVDWSPANAAAAGLGGSQEAGAAGAYTPAFPGGGSSERPPFPHLTYIAQTAAGDWIAAQRPSAPREEPVIEAAPPVLPRYLFKGVASALIDGRMVERGSKIDTVFWPIDSDLMPQNAPAQAVADYYAANADDPRLPPTAWDIETQSVNTIPEPEAE